MENDPLKTLIKSPDEISRMRHKGEIIDLFLPPPRVLERDYKKLVQLASFESALWNLKQITADEFAHAFWRIFQRECLIEHRLVHSYLVQMLSPKTKPLSAEEKKERARITVRKWREKNPDYKERKRFAREEAKRRRQGGYVVLPLRP